MGWIGYLRPDQFLDHLTVIITTIQVSAWTDWIKQKIKLSDSKEGEDPKVAFAADEEKIGTDEEEIAADEEEIGADEGEFAKFFNSHR